MITLTTIIPAYNAAPYIKRCLESLLLSYERVKHILALNIVIIDDGSSDETIYIIEPYVNNLDFIKVFSQQNKGVAAARNLGLSYAAGDFVTFVDADDTVTEDYFSDIAGELHLQPDLILFGCNRIGKRHIQKFSLPESMSQPELFMQYPICMNSSWCKVIKRELIVDSGIRFDTGLEVMEDLLFSFSIMAVSKKVRILNSCLYNYYINKDSVTNNLKEKYNFDSITAVKKVEKYAAGFGIYYDWNNFIVYLKIFAKRPFLFENRFFSIDRWLNTFSEVNSLAKRYARNKIESYIYSLLMMNRKKAVVLISHIYMFFKSVLKRTR